MNKKNWYVISAISLSLVGGIVLIGFLIKLSLNYSIFGDKVLLNETAQVGDFIGGLIGSLWALAGVLLFFSALKLQKKEFELQRNEFKEQRFEFMTNRITNIIYKQKELLDYKIYDEKVTLKLGNDTFNGVKAFNKIKQYKGKYGLPTEISKLSKADQDEIFALSQFFFTHDGEELLSTIHSSFVLLYNFITEKDLKGEDSAYLLDAYTRKQLFTLMRSMYRFREIEDFVIAIKAILFMNEQQMVGIPSAIEHFNYVKRIASETREIIHRIITQQLGESKYEYSMF